MFDICGPTFFRRKARTGLVVAGFCLLASPALGQGTEPTTVTSEPPAAVAQPAVPAPTPAAAPVAAPRVPQAGDSDRASPPVVAAPEPPQDKGHGGFAIELSTAGLMSGALLIGGSAGSIGGSAGNGIVVGAIIDYRRTSVDGTDMTWGTTKTVTSGFRFGFGIRVPIAVTRDRRGDLILAGDLVYAKDNVDVSYVQNPSMSTEHSGEGPSFAFGPGVRYWFSDQIALSYTGRFRATSYSRPFGSSESTNDLGLEGAFHITGVF